VHDAVIYCVKQVVEVETADQNVDNNFSAKQYVPFHACYVMILAEFTNLILVLSWFDLEMLSSYSDICVEEGCPAFANSRHSSPF